jgi:hypothetical protein
LQELFGLDLFGQDLYAITGSWENPEVKPLLEKSTTSSESELDDDF